MDMDTDSIVYEVMKDMDEEERNLLKYIREITAKEHLSRKDYESVLTPATKKYNIRMTKLNLFKAYAKFVEQKLCTKNPTFEHFAYVGSQSPACDLQAIEELEESHPKRRLLAAVKFLAVGSYSNRKEYDKAVSQMRKRYKIAPRKSDMNRIYSQLIKDKTLERNTTYEHFAIKKIVRSASGVLVCTVLTSPYPESMGKKNRFDCKYNCFYCPDEPGQPRSYLSTEPAVRRANENYFDPVEQVRDRIGCLVRCGHVDDKLEILVLGGTWSSYPLDYRETFIRDLYWAANVCIWHNPDNPREKQSLAEERVINETAKARIIGITLETRPDNINKTEIKHFRRFGCTRVQLGFQHTSDDVLKFVNRMCTNKHNKRGLKMLKEAGFKVDIHLMPDLPSSTPAIDLAMFHDVITNPDLQADQWKIYPCSVTRWTTIEKWYNEGSYKPYADIDNGRILTDVICKVKKRVPPYIRLNRVVRDIPNQSILGGNENTNLRQDLSKILKDRGTPCQCIRCREPKDDKHNLADAELIVRKYLSSNGWEHFISIEAPVCPLVPIFPKPVLEIIMALVAVATGLLMTDDRNPFKVPDLMTGPVDPLMLPGVVAMILLLLFYVWYTYDEHSRSYRPVIYGMLRLRFNRDPDRNIFPELVGCSMIRELHVYGRLISVSDKNLHNDRPQHSGFGNRMINKAIEITKAEGLSKIAVISGDGVKGYYADKHGFAREGDYMTKCL